MNKKYFKQFHIEQVKRSSVDKILFYFYHVFIAMHQVDDQYEIFAIKVHIIMLKDSQYE